LDGTEDGWEIFCRWCGNGGDLVCCDACNKSFCRKCIGRNFSGREAQRIFREADTWKCFCCDPSQVHEMMRKWAHKWGVPKSKLPPPKPHPRYAHTTAAQVSAQATGEGMGMGRGVALLLYGLGWLRSESTRPWSSWSPTHVNTCPHEQIEAALATSKGKKRRELVQTPVE
jgi:hypothetical protein